ncbi:AGAP002612-PA [Anopheles gambiae str. PEST]|uniref:AGAP002612-PA n=3 Tax=gambiae species complex TaxID=44542 RepID=Q7QCG2_ANOGA|nr:endocuticle structural glycoprotein SgAbd-5-like [Anopheles coluzzii]XP_312323.3 endocuticle structural glycoprotein SgAbd-5 [Anopheles gambiae]EAA07635.3 AGAP002612-PA [Anopheles gambiae str. PEST]
MQQQVFAFLVLCTLVGAAVGAPVDSGATPYIVQYENNNAQSEGYNFGFELSDEQRRKEEGTIRYSKDEEGKDVQFVAVQGHYSYVGDDGRTYWVEYVADENGYRSRMGTGDYDTDRKLELSGGERKNRPFA